MRDVTVDAGERRPPRADRRRRARARRASRSSTSPTGRSCCTSAARSRWSSKSPLKTRDDLSMAYTPGVARVCTAIADDPAKVWNLTIKQNTVAVVSDGTAVLGLGDIGPEAAMPVMEGKAMLFKEFGGVDAWPICLATKDVDEIVAAVDGDRARLRRHQPRGHLRAALLRDREPAAGDARHPRLPRRPARHGDRRARGVPERAARRRQAARGRARRADRRGAAGVATTDMLLAAGVRDIDRLRPPGRALRRPRPTSARAKAAFAERHEPARASRGTADEALAGADVFIGLSGAGRRHARRRSRRWPTARSSSRWRTRRPRSLPEEIEGLAAVVATGRSDYPNQINNVLAFPGVFRGALDVRASAITEEMKLAAAEAIAAVVKPDELERGVRRPERLQPRRRAGRRRGGRRRRPRRAASPAAARRAAARLAAEPDVRPGRARPQARAVRRLRRDYRLAERASRPCT